MGGPGERQLGIEVPGSLPTHSVSAVLVVSHRPEESREGEVTLVGQNTRPMCGRVVLGR